MLLLVPAKGIKTDHFASCLPSFYFYLYQSQTMQILTLLNLFLALWLLTACQAAQEGTTSSNSSPSSASPTAEIPVTEVPPQPFANPNLVAEVQVASGTCPETVGIYSFLLPYEGGAEHTAVADLWGMAQLPELVTQQETYLEYQATLSDRYADCVGTATIAMPDVYAFVFEEGQVRFSVDLRGIDAPALAITDYEIVAQRPYIRWAIAD